MLRKTGVDVEKHGSFPDYVRLPEGGLDVFLAHLDGGIEDLLSMKEMASSFRVDKGVIRFGLLDSCHLASKAVLGLGHTGLIRILLGTHLARFQVRRGYSWVRDELLGRGRRSGRTRPGWRMEDIRDSRSSKDLRHPSVSSCLESSGVGECDCYDRGAISC